MANGDPIKGTNGKFEVGASGAPQVTGKIEKWSFKSERSSEEIGPFIGEDSVTEVLGGKKGSLELEGIIPEGGDAGQDDVIEAYEAGTPLRTVVTVTKGKVITFASGVYKSLEISVDAKGTHRFKASVAGAYTIAQAPAV
jgi:hypothetical protein